MEKIKKLQSAHSFNYKAYNCNLQPWQADF